MDISLHNTFNGDSLSLILLARDCFHDDLQVSETYQFFKNILT